MDADGDTIMEPVNSNNITINNIGTNYRTIVENFIKSYYKEIETNGFAGVLNFFSQKCRYTYKTFELVTYNYILSLWNNLGIHKLKINNIEVSFQQITVRKLLINCKIYCNTINQYNQLSGPEIISETFILDIQDNYKICNYIFN